MQISSPPAQFDKPELDIWLRELYSVLLSQPASDSVPTSATDVGVKGQMAFDSSFLYICVDINSWKRVAIVVW